ncbi:MAG TPA: hypothetical protein VFK39_14340 [Gemmatimonadaceae bacterium]|nr:hypothetical protein [Gemmatimonadaceae bacterium]
MSIALLCAAVIPARRAQAQAAAGSAGASPGAGSADTTRRFVSGRVVHPSGSGVAATPDVWVTLHRVGPDSSGPIDSARTRSDGGYAFRYRLSGSPQAIYFLSVSFRGVAYFSAPLREQRVTGEDGEITVFDTTSAPIPLHVQGRHLVVSSPNADGMREIVEVYEISNDTNVTRVSPDDAHPTWSAIIPSAAEDFQLAQADISPSSIRADSGRVSSVAPFAPGLKQISFAYFLPESAFPLEIPLTDSVPVLEVLLEEPGARATGARLSQVAAVSLEGRNFNRFLAQDAPRNAVLTITAPAPGTPPLSERFQVVLVAVIALVMFGALAVTFSRRRAAAGTPGGSVAVAAAPPPVPAEGEEAARIAREIAELDAAHERNGKGGAEADEAYRARRAELKQALAAALDAHRSDG